MKKLAKYLLVLGLVILLAGWLLLSVFDANQLKKPVLSWLNEHTEINLSIGNLEFNPLHPYTLLAEDVQLGDWFRARQVYVQLATLSPLSGHTRIATLDLIDANLRLDHATELVLPDNLANISIDELNGKNVSLSWQAWEAKGADLTIRHWQPRREGAWQWWSDFTLDGQLRQLTHPDMAMAQISFNGQLARQQLQLTRLQSRLFDGLLDTRLTLNLPRQEVTLTAPSFSHNRLQFDRLPQLASGWTLLLNRAELNDVSITSPLLTSNGIKGELPYLEWQAGGLPEARARWQADEAVLDWLRLDKHGGELLSSREQLGLSLNGQAYEGTFNSELRWTPQQARLDIDMLELQGNKLVWQPDLYWPTPDVRLHKLNVSRGELLSLDDALPLSIWGGDLFVADLAWSAGQWRPLSEQARIEARWDEIAYNSLIARQGLAKARLDDTHLILEQLSTEALDGQLSVSGQIGRYAPHSGTLRLDGQSLALRPLSRWLNGDRGFAGTLDIQAALDGDLQRASSWQGQLAIHGRDIFIEKLGLDTWLKNRLGEDYRHEKAVDPVLAALDLAQSDGFIYQARLAGPVNRGRWRLDNSALQSVRHLLALRGNVDFSGSWQLQLGVINDQGCRELAIALTDTWRAPRLTLQQPPLATPCQPWYQGEVPYPDAGLPGRLIEAVRKLDNGNSAER
ncbi:hypothetical protein [Oceanisphaera sp.]|uniref:hypothetical protein n=1 Tax=Oceanisphaera sp. TaxID=1929979 RepID=UPI003A936EA3